MPIFEYKARTKDGEVRSGIIETSSQEAALEALQRQNLTVTLLEEKARLSFFEMRLGGGVKQKDVVIFSRQLATLFEAQIPIVESLRTVISETSNTTFREAAAQILDDVSGGIALSNALARHPSIFSSFYIQLVHSGEESGKLQEVFSYIADYTERSYYLTTKARNALMYPAFVTVTFFGVIVVMLVAVVPRLLGIFEETGQTIPWYTQAILGLSVFLRTFGLFILIALVAGAFFLWRWAQQEMGRLYFHRLQISLPILGTIFQKLYMARFADNLYTLIIGGIPILRALAISGDVVGNAVYQGAINDAAESVKRGGSISDAFEKNSDIPPLVTQMIRIGETSGKLDFILAKIAKFYQREVDSAFENLVSLIEPALIIFLGIGVGVLVAAVLVPLYSLVGSI